MSNFFLESTHDSSGKIARVSAVISASPQDIFALLADPAQHATIDGSGSVKSARDEHPARLELGTKFGMEMKVGVPYKITNEVVEFIEGERIAWRHFGGHIWRYILVADGTNTCVTEEFDYAHAKSPFFLKLMGYPDKNRKSMEKTLERMQKYFTTPR
jgi:hypothetical protein